MPVFENAKVESRYFARDLDWFGHDHDFTEVNDIYIEVALDLSERAILKVTKECGISPSDFDVIFFLSTTGISTPSIDARLTNRIKFSPHIKRIPIWGLGCAGGAAGLARAHDYLKAYPTHRALVVGVELCSLAFQRNDRKKSDIISVALFGDGAAACVMVGDSVPLNENTGPHPSTISSLSTIYPDSEEVMSWKVTKEGFKVSLSKDIPMIVHSLVKPNVTEFLTQNELSIGDISHFVLHPGGMKVLQAYSEGLEISMERLQISKETLRDYGNMSSVTVYFILERFLRTTREKSDEYGLLASLGPGFCSELLLLKWD